MCPNLRLLAVGEQPLTAAAGFWPLASGSAAEQPAFASFLLREGRHF